MNGKGILNSDDCFKDCSATISWEMNLSIKKHNQAICVKLTDLWGGENTRIDNINNNKPSFRRYPIEVSCSLFRIL